MLVKNPAAELSNFSQVKFEEVANSLSYLAYRAIAPLTLFERSLDKLLASSSRET